MPHAADVAIERIGELLRYGARLEVLEPPELRQRLAETSRQLAALYGA